MKIAAVLLFCAALLSCDDRVADCSTEAKVVFPPVLEPITASAAKRICGVNASNCIGCREHSPRQGATIEPYGAGVLLRCNCGGTVEVKP